MMDLSTEKNIEKGKAAFEDLHLLADPVLFPLIGRAYHHFSEVASSTYQKQILSELPVLQKFISLSFNSLLEDFFRKKDEGLLWSVIKDDRKLEVSHWEKILSVLPDVLQVVGCFKFKGCLTIEVSPKGMSFKGGIFNGQSIRDHRLTIYKAFRRLLSKKTLLTFDVTEKEGSFETELSLFADISHQDSDLLAYNFAISSDQKQSSLIAFSSVLKNYRISLSELESLGDHITIQITPKMEVVKRDKLPDSFKSVFASSEIIHFHFLFRPISLIIGAKGKNLPRHALGGTGSDLFGTSQEVGKLFDIFSLLSL